MPPEAMFDFRDVDFGRIVADREAIRKINPQRFEMEQLTAVVHLDRAQHIAIGYRDYRDEEFWVRGHMPDYPLVPGVLICEAAAQLSGYYCRWAELMGGDFVAFGGLENVRFRGPVRPGDRLVLIAKATRVHHRQIVSATQGFVNNKMVYHGDIIGVPFSRSGEV